MLHQQINCTGRIHNDRVIEVNEEIIEERNIIPIYQQNYAEYLSHYRSQKKQQSSLNIIVTILIDDINEYYIGSGCVLYSLQCKTFRSCKNI